ncbi:MDR family MFS transporter [Bacillus sp. KH172YL63]|uniref:MDR family MFS transporter n=1 Tax=Bacillus sp. KH172YL63 TaxID=2709784 RepID=UPI0013E4BC55|nr:MDR family MFS transporter [Bacillus sp. KH172YL63]BCB03171.1 MFS transporter [Bacillus sp. KH172YL63]
MESTGKNIPKITKKPLVLISVMLAMFMGAIEATIVSTAMPAIVGDLGGFSLYSWVFSAYLLMNAITVLIYGKLSDLYGRKPIITFGIMMFLIGSVACGMAQSMEQLILFRFIQGFGAGAVLPMATTIVGDIYSREERAKIQGYLSSVWGISAVSGPLVGGLLVEYASWRYVFWVNIPLGLLAIAGLWLYLHEEIEKKKPEIDVGGAGLLVVSLASLLFLLVEGGLSFQWVSWQAALLIGIFLIGSTVFIIHERRTPQPMMPFDLWKVRSITVANVVSLTTGVIIIGISSFLPAFVQGVMERSATVAGFTLTAMSIGWPISATIGGRLLLKIGYFKTSLIGGVALITGGVFFLLMDPSSGPLWAAVGSFFVGVGMGLTSTSFIVSIQSSVTWESRGIATATNMFMRNLGTTIGAALLGGILNSRLKTYFEHHGQDYSIDDVNMLLNPAERKSLAQEELQLLQGALTSSLDWVYGAVFLFAVISFTFILFFPKVLEK